MIQFSKKSCSNIRRLTDMLMLDYINADLYVVNMSMLYKPEVNKWVVDE